MKVILCGYNWIGCKALDLLIEMGCEVFVYTHESPYYINDLAIYCRKRNVEHSLEKIQLNNLPFIPDIIASIYYRYIISDKVIKACNNKIFNLHPSLLPEYRGCSSLTWAMVNGETYAGYSYHYLTSDVDCGNIIVQEKIKIEEFDTQQTLYYRVMFEAIKKFEVAFNYVKDNFEGFSQDLSKGKHFQRGAPFSGQINPNWGKEEKERFIRAMIFPPLPVATFKDRNIFKVSEIDGL